MKAPKDKRTKEYKEWKKKYNKAELYEKKLPSVVIVAVSTR